MLYPDSSSNQQKSQPELQSQFTLMHPNSLSYISPKCITADWKWDGRVFLWTPFCLQMSHKNKSKEGGSTPGSQGRQEKKPIENCWTHLKFRNLWTLGDSCFWDRAPFWKLNSKYLLWWLWLDKFFMISLVLPSIDEEKETKMFLHLSSKWEILNQQHPLSMTSTRNILQINYQKLVWFFTFVLKVFSA